MRINKPQRLPDHEIAERVGLCERQVVRIRQQFVRRRRRAGAGAQEAVASWHHAQVRWTSRGPPGGFVLQQAAGRTHPLDDAIACR